MAQARQRVAGRANVEVVEADATAWQPGQPADLVLLSYALSMMPSWRGVIANARRMLAPGGRIAVVDFYVSAATPAPGLSRHGLFTRALLWAALAAPFEIDARAMRRFRSFASGFAVPNASILKMYVSDARDLYFSTFVTSHLSKDLV